MKQKIKNKKPDKEKTSSKFPAVDRIDWEGRLLNGSLHERHAAITDAIKKKDNSAFSALLSLFVHEPEDKELFTEDVEAKMIKHNYYIKNDKFALRRILRDRAVEAIAKIGISDKQFERLLWMLKNGSAAEKCASAIALRYIGNKKAIQAFRESLQDKEVAILCVYGLQELGVKEAVPEIIETLKSDDLDLIFACGNALSDLGVTQDQFEIIVKMFTQGKTECEIEGGMHALECLREGGYEYLHKSKVTFKDQKTQAFYDQALNAVDRELLEILLQSFQSDHRDGKYIITTIAVISPDNPHFQEGLLTVVKKIEAVKDIYRRGDLRDGILDILGEAKGKLSDPVKLALVKFNHRYTISWSEEDFLKPEFEALLDSLEDE